MGRVFANGPGDLCSIPCRVIPKTLKIVLDTFLLNTQLYKVRIKGKVEQSRERSSSSPTPRCSSNWKWSLLLALDYGRQLYLLHGHWIPTSKKGKRTVDFDVNHKNLQPRIWHWKNVPCLKWKVEKNNVRMKTAESGKYQNTCWEGKLQILGNIGSGHDQTSGDERKNNKSVLQTKEKTSRNQPMQQKSYERNKPLGNLHCNTLWSVFLKWTWQELRQINQKKRKSMTKRKTLHGKDDIDRQTVSSKKEEDFPVLSIV